ncbi:MAG: hypothetical protein OEM63_08830 [Gammaproteobacteria bacterium]|nr:hypothetical protein [Gammaproteobacteria bacterium]
MTPSDVLKELLVPVVDKVLLIAIAMFGGALWLSLVVMQLGPLFVIFGLLIGLAVLGTMFRYAIQVLENRSQGLRTPVLDIDALTLFSNAWTLFPMVLCVAVGWAATYLGGTGNAGAATALAVVFALLFPASMGVLAITHSPLESIKPVALYRLIQRCGASYVWIPVVIAAMTFATAGISQSGAPLLLIVVLRTYIVFLAFTLTGAVVRESGVSGDVSIGEENDRYESDYRDELTGERQKVADHAYGFISRGNREGGFKHIRQWINSDPDPDDAVGWFFNEMMRWENKDAALFFGQECLSHFLHHDNDALALKLIARCLHETPAWKPNAEDRPHALALAEKYQRDDLLQLLRS